MNGVEKTAKTCVADTSGLFLSKSSLRAAILLFKPPTPASQPRLSDNPRTDNRASDWQRYTNCQTSPYRLQQRLVPPVARETVLQHVGSN